MAHFVEDKEQLMGELDSLSGEIRRLLGLDDEIRRIIETIKNKKGWTTPVEFYLVSSVVDSLKTQVRGVHDLSAALVNGSLAIDVKENPVETPVWNRPQRVDFSLSKMVIQHGTTKPCPSRRIGRVFVFISGRVTGPGPR